MTDLRQKVREAIRIIRESDMRWVLTQKGRAALRTACSAMGSLHPITQGRT